jgi:hypothetical protein
MHESIGLASPRCVYVCTIQTTVLISLTTAAVHSSHALALPHRMRMRPPVYSERTDTIIKRTGAPGLFYIQSKLLM